MAYKSQLELPQDQVIIHGHSPFSRPGDLSFDPSFTPVLLVWSSTNLWLISLSVHAPYDLLWPLLGDLHDGASERGVRSPELTPHRVALLTCPVPLPVLPSVPLNQPGRDHPAVLKALNNDSAMHLAPQLSPPSLRKPLFFLPRVSSSLRNQMLGPSLYRGV